MNLLKQVGDLFLESSSSEEEDDEDSNDADENKKDVVDTKKKVREEHIQEKEEQEEDLFFEKAIEYTKQYSKKAMEFSKKQISSAKEDLVVLAKELKEDFIELREEFAEDFRGANEDSIDDAEDDFNDNHAVREEKMKRKVRRAEERKRIEEEEGVEFYDSDDEEYDSEDDDDDDLVLVQEQLEKAGEKIEQFGRNAARFTGNLFSQVKETIKQAQMESDRQRLKNALARSGVGVSTSSSYNNTLGGRGDSNQTTTTIVSKEKQEQAMKEQEFNKGVSAIQRDSGTYCEAPEDDDVEFQEFNKTWTLEEAKEDIDHVLKEAPFMRELRGRIVPLIVDEDDFWRRYFFAVQKLRVKIYPPTPLVTTSSSLSAAEKENEAKPLNAGRPGTQSPSPDEEKEGKDRKENVILKSSPENEKNKEEEEQIGVVNAADASKEGVKVVEPPPQATKKKEIPAPVLPVSARQKLSNAADTETDSDCLTDQSSSWVKVDEEERSSSSKTTSNKERKKKSPPKVPPPRKAAVDSDSDDIDEDWGME